MHTINDPHLHFIISSLLRTIRSDVHHTGHQERFDCTLIYICCLLGSSVGMLLFYV